jgi:hypothetical protein
VNENGNIKTLKPFQKGVSGNPHRGPSKVGSNKEPINIYIHKERAAKLRELAITDQRTVSVIVERALEQTYGIWNTISPERLTTINSMDLTENTKLQQRIELESKLFAYACDPKAWSSFTPTRKEKDMAKAYKFGVECEIKRILYLIDALLIENENGSDLKRLRRKILHIGEPMDWVEKNDGTYQED